MGVLRSKEKKRREEKREREEREREKGHREWVERRERERERERESDISHGFEWISCTWIRTYIFIIYKAFTEDK